MIVKEQREIFFRNKCSCLVDEDELKKAILWYSDEPVTQNKKIFISGNYPAVYIYNEKIHVHRLLMAYWLKRKLSNYEIVHHQDGDKLNSLRQNLGLIRYSDHQRMHNKGKTLSAEHRQKISNANRRRKGIRYKNIHENSELLEDIT
ncbi:MAG: hypothetical protein WA051_01430 [Minisyncoccia bacterium]